MDFLIESADTGGASRRVWCGKLCYFPLCCFDAMLLYLFVCLCTASQTPVLQTPQTPQTLQTPQKYSKSLPAALKILEILRPWSSRLPSNTENTSASSIENTTWSTPITVLQTLLFRIFLTLLGAVFRKLVFILCYSNPYRGRRIRRKPSIFSF